MVCESGGKGDERGTGRLVTEVGEEDSSGHDGHMICVAFPGQSSLAGEEGTRYINQPNSLHILCLLLTSSMSFSWAYGKQSSNI